MKFYHGTTEEAWVKIQSEGLLWGIGNSYRHTYLVPDIQLARSMGRGNVILEVEYKPIGIDGRVDGKRVDNYIFRCDSDPPDHYCWQFIVSIPISICKVKRI